MKWSKDRTTNDVRALIFCRSVVRQKRMRLKNESSLMENGNCNSI